MSANTQSDELVTANLPLVGYLVSEVLARVPAHVRRDDLTSAGYLALVQAARAYDPERGVPFGRYAAMRIRGALVDDLRTLDWASRSVRTRARTIDNAREQLSVRLGRAPSDSEIAAHLGIDAEDVRAVTGDIHRAGVLSLQDVSDRSDLDEMLSGHEPDPEQDLLHRERLGYLADAVTALPERLRLVIEGTFFADRPAAELAAEFGVTESRISQMRSEALSLLRDGMNSQLDPDQMAAPGRPGGCANRRREAYYAAIAARQGLRIRPASAAVAA
jgi:RNA polymerase sigma factor for flagellar operon FliA